MAISTGSHPKDLWPGVKAHFGHTYDEHPEEFSQIFDAESSDKGWEERVQYKGLGLATVKGQGEPIDFSDTQQGYISRITNVVYGKGGIVTREAIEDGQYESVAMRISRYIAFSIRQTEENVGANVLNRAFNSSYTGGDGVELCSLVHEGDQSNHLTVAADISEAAIEDMLIQIMLSTDAEGLKISLIGQKLVSPPQQIFESCRILDSMLQNDTSDNAINALKAKGMLPGGVVVNHYLSDADAWFIKTNAPEGMIVQNRRAVEFGKDNDFSTENALMKGTIRKGYGWADWRGLFGSPGV